MTFLHHWCSHQIRVCQNFIEFLSNRLVLSVGKHDETSFVVCARAAGWIERVYRRYPGDVRLERCELIEW
jgi:hypothetical protein